MSGLYQTEVDGTVKASLIRKDKCNTMGFLRSSAADSSDSVFVLPNSTSAQGSPVIARSSDKPGRSVEKPPSEKVMLKRLLSVTDLLQRAENLKEASADLFPLIDKDKYFHHESIESIPNDANLNISGNDYQTCIEIQTLEQDVDNTDDGSAECDPLNNRKNGMEVLRKLSKPDCIVKAPRLPPREFVNELRTDVALQTWIGVTVEYIEFSNRLKINVSMLNGNVKKKDTGMFASVFLMPGTMQKQKIDVTSGLGHSLSKSSGNIRGIKGSDLINMTIGVRLCAKNGFFRKRKIIHEWSIAIDEMDFIEAQTAWKKIQFI